jgi:heptosyltransferase-2
MFKKIAKSLFYALEIPIQKSTRIIYPGVPHEPEPYLQSVSKIQIAKKYLHKYLLLKIYGQLKLRKEFAPEDKKILWLYTGKRNFGDAVMDLSGRSLLKKSNIHLDLFTLPHLKNLFKEDDIFKNIYDLDDEIQTDGYDFIIISEFNLPSIRLKNKLFKKTEFACLYDFFYGPDRNQIIFSHAAINHVFRLGNTVQEIESSAKPYLAQKTPPIDDLQKDYISICIGGIDDNRTYKKWGDVLRLLDEHQDSPSLIYLLGSSNGLEAAREICSLKFNRLEIINKVDSLNLLKSREIIANSSLYIGCDGGLMHVAHTTNTPSVSIFNQSESPYLRLTQSCLSHHLHSQSEVSAITPQSIFEAIKSQLNKC